MKKIEVNKPDVIDLLTKGYTQLETARKLNISLSTLKRLPPFWKDVKAKGQKQLYDILPTIDFDTCIDKEFLSFTYEFMDWLKDDPFLE